MLGVHANKKKKKKPRELHIKYYNFCNNYSTCQTVTDCLSLSHESITFFFSTTQFATWTVVAQVIAFYVVLKFLNEQ